LSATFIEKKKKAAAEEFWRIDGKRKIEKKKEEEENKVESCRFEQRTFGSKIIHLNSGSTLLFSS